MAGAKQARGGERRRRKARKGKGEEVPFLSLIPSTFSFLPLPFQSLSRRLEVVAWYERRAATFNAWSLSNRQQRYGNRSGKPSSTGTSCDPGMNRARGGS